jgi:hypothetical protein
MANAEMVHPHVVPDPELLHVVKLLLSTRIKSRLNIRDTVLQRLASNLPPFLLTTNLFPWSFSFAESFWI